MGTLPALVYGAAIDGIVGAALGLVVWGLLCALAAGVDRLRRRRRPGPPTPATGTTVEAELFDQLRRTPCVVCGAPTLLDACLDCEEGWIHPSRRRDDVTRWDEPDDPAR